MRRAEVGGLLTAQSVPEPSTVALVLLAWATIVSIRAAQLFSSISLSSQRKSCCSMPSKRERARRSCASRPFLCTTLRRGCGGQPRIAGLARNEPHRRLVAPMLDRLCHAPGVRKIGIDLVGNDPARPAPPNHQHWRRNSAVPLLLRPLLRTRRHRDGRRLAGMSEE